ncbi:Mitochondrial RNA pseudouridine synthase Rpusd4 [Chionoecetes opilio]|uniref:Pseudouridylate synthase RPUSD4, mitochondrial n=1 Tax=Chionoecetes opilio TaxID=41210 RepID=A0A8J5CSY3_CHIOP|nr:Mitochondrial RNA pseudouridine synthase Rpusd4 [Chionoecetes opilio]
MWGRARMCFSPVKGTCKPQRHTFTRGLKTQCTNFHPRGHSRRDVIQASQQGKILIDEVPGTSKPSPTEYKDTRSIDAVDPVVLKYTNMVNEMRSKSSGIERVNETHFGSIRFDQENVPHLHGLFDQEYGPDATASKHTTPKVHLKLLHEGGQRGVKVIKEEEQSEYSGGGGGSVYQEYQNRLNASKEEQKTGDERMRNYGTDSSSGASEVNSNDSAMRQDSYIDDCVFGDSLSSISSNSTRQPMEHMQSTDSEIGGNANNLNYVDEVFFKNSIENLEINRQPSIDYSEIKNDLENTVLSSDTHLTSEDETGEILSHVTKRNVEQKSGKNRDEINEESNTADNSEAPESAYEYVLNKRREEHKNKYGLAQTPGDGSSKSYKKILSLLSEKSKDRYTRYEVLKSLKSSILYNDHDIVGLHKPYGIAMHGGTDSQHHVLTDYLPDLAHFLQAEALYPVHRLDATTTGVVLLARTPAMADILKSLFKERKLKKTYWAITKGIPKPLQGIIDIPIAEGTVDGRRRMVLKPDVKELRSTSSSSKLAITKFRTISHRESAALVELFPMTGVKHQLRVHLAFGLSCPVFGDHKYSHVKKMAPQALPGDMLDKLKMKQSKVRQLPLFLHCKSILVPEIVDGRNIFIQSKIPAYFNKALTILKLNRHESKVKFDGLMSTLMN